MHCRQHRPVNAERLENLEEAVRHGLDPAEEHPERRRPETLTRVAVDA